MIVSSLAPAELRRRLRAEGLGLVTGPFHFRIRSRLEPVVEGLRLLYADHPLAADGAFADFEVVLDGGAGVRRWLRPQARFLYDGEAPFEPLPAGHAMPLLEWAMNWCISSQAHQYLMLHAAVVERHGRAALLAAPSGSGKSTLCGALMCRGWRLLSDELALISPDTLDVAGLGRPVSLKNESIDVLRAFEPGARFGAVTHDTHKGSVAHMKAPRPHVERIDEPARPAWVFFPRFVRGAPPRLAPRSRAASMLELGRNAFNYSLLGRVGFDTLAEVVSRCECHDFTYGSLDDAVATFEALAGAGSA